MMTTRGRLRARALGACAVAAALVGLSGAAMAPAGATEVKDADLIQTESTGATIEVRLLSSPVRATALAIDLGLASAAEISGTDRGELGAGRDGHAWLQDSEVYEAYLRDHVSVEAVGRACEPAKIDISDLAADGARVAFKCDGQVTSYDLTSTVMTDVDPAYKVRATGPDGQRATYSLAEPTHNFHAPYGVKEGNLSSLAAWGGLGLGGAVATAGVVMWRRRAG